jgi:hypothetical protein
MKLFNCFYGEFPAVLRGFELQTIVLENAGERCFGGQPSAEVGTGRLFDHRCVWDLA